MARNGRVQRRGRAAPRVRVRKAKAVHKKSPATSPESEGRGTLSRLWFWRRAVHSHPIPYPEWNESKSGVSELRSVANRASKRIPERVWFKAFTYITAAIGGIGILSVLWVAIDEHSCQADAEIVHAFKVCGEAEGVVCFLGPRDLVAYSRASKALRLCPVEYRD